MKGKIVLAWAVLQGLCLQATDLDSALSELPLDKLLHVRRSLTQENRMKGKIVLAWAVLQGLGLQATDLDSALSELPLDKLLHVRRSLTQEINVGDMLGTVEGTDLPEALPLSGGNKKNAADKTFAETYFDEDWKSDPWKQQYWNNDYSWNSHDIWNNENPWKEEESWKDHFKNKLKDKFKDHFSKLFHKNKNKKSNKIQKIFQISVTLLAFLAFGGYLVALVLLTMRQSDVTLLATTITPESRGRIYRRDVANSSDTDLFLSLRRLSEGFALYNEHCAL